MLWQILHGGGWRGRAAVATPITLLVGARAQEAAGAGPEGDAPTNSQDLTIFVQSLLEQMARAARAFVLGRARAADSQTSASSLSQQSRFEQMSDQIIGRIDEMGNRIDDLEKSIGELMEQAGVEPVVDAAPPGEK